MSARQGRVGCAVRKRRGWLGWSGAFGGHCLSPGMAGASFARRPAISACHGKSGRGPDRLSGTPHTALMGAS